MEIGALLGRLREIEKEDPYGEKWREQYPKYVALYHDMLVFCEEDHPESEKRHLIPMGAMEHIAMVLDGYPYVFGKDEVAKLGIKWD